MRYCEATGTFVVYFNVTDLMYRPCVVYVSCIMYTSHIYVWIWLDIIKVKDSINFVRWANQTESREQSKVTSHYFCHYVEYLEEFHNGANIGIICYSRSGHFQVKLLTLSFIPLIQPLPVYLIISITFISPALSLQCAFLQHYTDKLCNSLPLLFSSVL